MRKCRKAFFKPKGQVKILQEYNIPETIVIKFWQCLY